MVRISFVAVLAIVLSGSATAQPPASSVGDTRLRAEAGDGMAQDRLGEAYLASFYFADAVKWFRLAVEKGVPNSQWRLGKLLLNGSSGFPRRSAKIPADPNQGIRWLKKAAATGHTGAQRDLAQCFESGKGVTKNAVEAHKWFGIAAKQDSILAKGYLNQLALRMKPTEIEEGERRIASFVVGAQPSLWEEIHLKGISGPAARRLAIINNTTIETGETVSMNVGGEKIAVKCERVNKDAVTLSIGDEVRELKLSSAPGK